MILFRGVLVDERLLTQPFACPLAACRGKCCVEGEEGPPVTAAEARFAAGALPALRPYMAPDAYQKAVREGVAETLPDGHRAFRCLPDGRCIFATISRRHIVRCALEQAHRDGVLPFPKPISCHLYPVRIDRLGATVVLRFDRWDVCRAAAPEGRRRHLRVFQFVKPALIRYFGAAWYAAFEKMAADYSSTPLR